MIRSSRLPAKKDINRVRLVGERREIHNLLVRIVKHFFELPELSIPFRGFLLEGVPSTGKTEIAKQVVRTVDTQIQTADVFWQFLDSADITAPKLGEAEKNLKDAFNDLRGKEIIIFDDIDCLMIQRGEKIAKEWTYSLNAILFHELDKIDPTQRIFIATTNRPNLVEEALRDRLYSIEVPSPTKEDLIRVAEHFLNDLEEAKKEKLLTIVKAKIENSSMRSFRELQNIIVKNYLEEIVGGVI